MISWKIIALRLVLAAVLGAVVGLERERKDGSAGMRTHMMVCLGAALTIIVSAFGFSDILGHPNVILDPSRIAAQVISGIGFLGAGIIIFLKPGLIRGLTTAAALWTVAAVGLAVGSGMYFAGVVTTVIALIILFLLQPIEKRVTRVFKQKSVRIVLDISADPTALLDEFIGVKRMPIHTFSFNRNKEEYVIEILFDELDFEKMMPNLLALRQKHEVKEILWNK